MTRRGNGIAGHLESVVNGLLRHQPDIPAPGELQMRVQREIARRAVLPWYRKSFLHWPLAARGGFLVASYGFAKLALVGVVALAAMVRLGRLEDLDPMAMIHVLGRITESSAIVGGSLIRVIPEPLLYGGLLLGVVLYLAVIGLGAISYRILCSK